MNNTRTILASIFIFGWALTTAKADVVINFDDINTGFGSVNIPSGYAGLTWSSNWQAWYAQGSIGYPPESDPNVVYVDDQNAATIVFPTPTTVVGFWFAGYSFDNTVSAISADDTLVGDLTYTAYTADHEAEWISLNWNNVASLDFSSLGGQRYFIIDDLTLGSAAAAPDFASSAALLALGLAGLAVFRRRAAV